jgi:hypothetical protein
MKSTALLATAFFLMSAPSPDSKTISEFSGGFYLPARVEPLMAAVHQTSTHSRQIKELTTETASSHSQRTCLEEKIQPC